MLTQSSWAIDKVVDDSDAVEAVGMTKVVMVMVAKVSADVVIAVDTMVMVQVALADKAVAEEYLESIPVSQTTAVLLQHFGEHEERTGAPHGWTQLEHYRMQHGPPNRDVWHPGSNHGDGPSSHAHGW